MNAITRRMTAALSALLLAASATLTGCASSEVATQVANLPLYSASAANRAMQAQIVTVESVQVVRIKEDSNNGVWSYAGPAIAAAAGGYVANHVGRGRGRDLATVAGGAIGGGLGYALQESASISLGYAFTISYADPSYGRISKVIVQAADDTLRRIAPTWRPGQPFKPVKARLTEGYSGDRVIPL